MNTHQPLYQQLADHFRDKIHQGEFNFGDSIPSEREIALQYGANRMTVRKALDLLVAEGMLVRNQGKGTFVQNPRLVTDMWAIQGFSEIIVREGYTVSSNVLSTGRRPARRRFAGVFSIGEDDEVFECVRLRLADGYPMVLEYVYIPVGTIPGLEGYDLKVYGFHDIYRESGIHIASEKQRLEVVRVMDPQATLLKVEEGASVFLLTSVMAEADGRVVEFARSYHSGERFTYSTMLVREGQA